MGHEHVDRGLRHLVHGDAEAGGDRRVEVRDLDLDPQLRGRGFAATSSARKPQPRPLRATSRPSRIRQLTEPCSGSSDVLGRVEPQQRERPGEEHDPARPVAVDDADEAERHLLRNAQYVRPRFSRLVGFQGGRGSPGSSSAPPTGPSGRRRRARSRSTPAARRSRSERAACAAGCLAGSDGPIRAAITAIKGATHRARFLPGYVLAAGVVSSATVVPGGSTPSPIGINRERVRLQQRGDDVRSLRTVGDARTTPSSRSRRTLIAWSRLRLRRTSTPSSAVARWPRSWAAPCSATSAGRTNSVNVTKADTGFPGSPNTSCLPLRSRTRSVCRAAARPPRTAGRHRARRAPA